MEYAIIIEGDVRHGFGAYSAEPDINVFATGKTEELVRKRVASGIRKFLEWLERDGDRIPRPTCKVYMQQIDFGPRASAAGNRKAKPKARVRTSAHASKSKRR